MGAPGGNQNAVKGKQFYDALRRAMASDDFARLRKAADRLLDKASEGEPWAIAELANRLDGKPAQQIALTGAEDGPVKVQAEVVFVGKDRSRNT
jgi:hypothetical protein